MNYMINDYYVGVKDKRYLNNATRNIRLREGKDQNFREHNIMLLLKQ